MPTGHNRKLREALAVLDGTVADVVAERRRTGPTGRDGDLVDLLLASDLDDVAIRDEIVTILLAGHETTGVSAAWTLYAVAQHPDVRDRLESEVDGVLPGGRAPEGDQLDALPYTRAVVAESLRLYPPIWQYPRDAAEDDVLAGYRVEQGSSVFLSVLATHHDPGLWPDPEVFDPSRFLTEEERHRFAYLPFGGGRRVCIGQRFALLLLWTLLAGAARRYRLSVVPGQDIRSGALLSLHPTNGIVVTLRGRAG